jgi:hypothetical protein
MISTLVAIAMAQAATAAPAVERETVDGPVTMTASEIRTYNAALQRDDPAYIRCQRMADTGSLVRKHTSCRTNAEWRRVHEIGNQNARDTVDNYQMHQSTRDPSEGLKPGG